MSKAKHYLKQREYNVQSTVCAIFPEAFEPQDGEAVSLFSDSRFEKKKKKRIGEQTLEEKLGTKSPKTLTERNNRHHRKDTSDTIPFSSNRTKTR
jgi:hypothetical protein